MIDRKTIEDRLAEFKSELAKLQANANALSGAIQFAEQLLAQDSKSVELDKDKE